MRARTKAKLAVAAALFLVLGIGAMTSNAVTVPTTRPSSPGSNYHWGIEWTSTTFPNMGTGVPSRSFNGAGFHYGGWNEAPEDYAIGRNNAGITTPVNVVLGEPFNFNNGVLSVPWYTTAYSDPRVGAANPQWKAGYQDAAGATTGKVYCSSTEWALSSAFFTKTATGLTSGNLQSNTANVTTVVGASGLNWVSYCKYIQAIVFSVCVYATVTATTYTCSEYTWTAERAFAHTPYSWSAPNYGLCSTPAGGAVSIDCQFVEGAGVDPTDFNQVCVKNAPTAVWGDFSWLGTTIAFYSKCLWVPNTIYGGWDRNDEISTAMTEGTLAEVAAQLEETGDSLAILESCGELIDGTGTVLTSAFNVNTCTWTWAPPIKSFLSMALVAQAGAWLLFFLIAVIGGVVNRNVPNPAAD